MPIMTEGADEAAEIAEDIRKKRGNRFRVQQLPIKADDDILLRFYNDHRPRPHPSGQGTVPGWISVDVHSFVPTKDRPEGYTGQNWPKSMWAVCQNDRMFRLRDPRDPRKLLDEYEEGYGNCWIHNTLAGVKDPKFGYDRSIPGAQVLSLAVLRQPVRDPADPVNGPVIGFTHQTAEWADEAGTVYQVPHFVVINQKYINFYAAVKAACFVEPQTACNKDFRVSRRENDYTITTVNLTPDFMPGAGQWAVYDDALKLMGFDLRAWVLDHASQDHYNRWFIPGATPEGGYGRRDANSTAAGAEEAASPAASAPATPVVDQAAMADFRNSLMVRGK